MHAIKDNYTFIKALAAVFCCTVLISQSGLLFAQDKKDNAAPPAKKAKLAKQANSSKPSTANNLDAGDGENADAKPADEFPPLAEMLAIALENNPDIGVAASQVQQAEAQLKRTQLNVVQQVMELREAWHAQLGVIRSSKAKIETARSRTEHMRARYEAARGTYEEILEAETQENAADIAVIQAQAKLAEIKAKIPYVLGVQKPVAATGTMSNNGRGRGTVSSPAAAAIPKVNAARGAIRPTATYLPVPAREGESPQLAKLREALQKDTEVDFVDQPVEEVADYISDLHNISVTFDKNAFNSSFTGDNGGNGKGVYLINCRHAGISLGAALQAIMDLHPQVTFVVRDYGLLATVKGKEPDGSIPVLEFLKQPPGAAKARVSFSSPGPWNFGAPQAKKPDAPKEKDEAKR